MLKQAWSSGIQEKSKNELHVVLYGNEKVLQCILGSVLNDRNAEILALLYRPGNSNNMEVWLVCSRTIEIGIEKRKTGKDLEAYIHEGRKADLQNAFEPNMTWLFDDWTFSPLNLQYPKSMSLDLSVVCTIWLVQIKEMYSRDWSCAAFLCELLPNEVNVGTFSSPNFTTRLTFEFEYQLTTK